MPHGDRPLRWRADLEAHVIDGDAAYLVSELEVLALEGRLADSLALAIDGRRNVEALVASLAPHFPPEGVRATLDQLAGEGLVVVSDTAATPLVAFYESAGASGDAVLQALNASRVAVVDLAGSGAATHERALRDANVPVCSDTETAPATLQVVLVGDYLQHELAAMNRIHLDSGTPWLLARPKGRVIWTGPLLVPGISACWECLAHRLEANRTSHLYLARRLARPSPVSGPTVAHSGGELVSAGLVALAATGHIGGLTHATSLRTDDLVSGESALHHVTRRPQCPACGDPTLMATRGLEPVHPVRRAKVTLEDGGHRSVGPAAMLARYGDQVSPLTGVATSLTHMAMPHEALHVVISGQNVARRPDGLEALRHGLRSLSCGKGLSEVQARASALGEAIERSSGVYQGDEPRREASLDELGDEAIDPRDCLLFSQRQYELRSVWNAGAAQFNFVHEPFDERVRLEWSPIWSLTQDRARWLPTQHLYYGYPMEGRPIVAYSDSNGCAAGSSLEDAMLQGICELFERDAVALWWYNRVQRPAIALDSLRDAFVDRMRQIYLDLGREVWALDLTADFGVPVVGAFSRALSSESEDILIAFGAHLDPGVAVLRALTEMNQFLTSVLPAFGGGPPDYSGDAAFSTWCQTARLDTHPYLVADPESPGRDVSTWPSLAGSDLLADLERCQSLLQSKGLELLVLDQTRPDVGLPVVKVLAPGMRHFWPRFAPGRLFDVPVELGWLQRPTPEEDLNLTGIFI